VSFDKAQLCAKLIKKPGMPEARPCLRKKGHRGGYRGGHSPDLTGLKNVFGYVEILRRGPDYVQPGSGKHQVKWVVQDRLGGKRLVKAASLFNGRARGINAAKRSGLGSKMDKFGKTYPEYSTVRSHYNSQKTNPSYKNMKFYDGWNPDKGGSIIEGARWLLRYRPKPDPNHQLHVLKPKKCPHGYFGPDDKDGRHIVWRSRMDRHDQDLLDLIHEWPKKKLREFVQNEIQPLLKVA